MEPGQFLVLLDGTCSHHARFMGVFMCIAILPACWSVHWLCSWPLRRSEEGTRSPEAGVTDDYEPPCQCWETYLSHLVKNPGSKQISHNDN